MTILFIKSRTCCGRDTDINMDEIICYTSYLPEGEERIITFVELLLDDNWAAGTIECPEKIYFDIGDMNHRLKGKQNYEFLLRAVQKYPLRAVGTSSGNDLSDCQNDEFDGYRTDCYIAGKYQKELSSLRYYTTVINELMTKARGFSDPIGAISWLRKMITHSLDYYEIDDDTQPILVYRDGDACHNVPASFANGLAQALHSCRQRVILWDVAGEEDCKSLAQFIEGKRFKAIIGIQSRLFLSSYLSGGGSGFLHDLVGGPKYNIIMDHPISIRRLFDNPPHNYYVLVHDRNYQLFIKKYWPKVKDSFCFPLGGMGSSDIFPKAKCIGGGRDDETFSRKQMKQYDIIFIGSCQNYRNVLKIIYNMREPYRILAARLLHMMRWNPDYTAERALHEVLDNYGIQASDNDFLNTLEALKCVTACVSGYYREKVVRAFLDAGMELHVYGKDWETAPLAKHKYIRCHPEIDVGESLRIMQQAKISINVMSWHKDGFTERILNGMLAGAVVVSDRSTRLEEEFVDGEDIILFNLANIRELPSRVKELLSDEERLKRIAANGEKKVREKHLWIHRAKELLNIIDNQTEGGIE